MLLLLLLQWLLHICLKSKMLVWARGRPVKQKCVKRKGKLWSTLLSHSFNCKCVNVDIMDNPLPPRPPPITQSCTAVFCIILCKVAPEISDIVPEKKVDWCCFSLCLTGDEIEPADGDIYETYRILFDITFFFFVIVILLAIIQGESVLWSKPGWTWQTGCVGECWSLIHLKKNKKIEKWKQQQRMLIMHVGWMRWRLLKSAFFKYWFWKLWKMRTATRNAKGVRPGMLKNVRVWTPPPPKKDIYITKEIIKKGRKKQNSQQLMILRMWILKWYGLHWASQRVIMLMGVFVFG